MTDWGHGDEMEDFLRVTPLDSAGRRALWMRFPPCTRADQEGTYGTVADGSLVELRAGREGDDAQVILREGEVLTREMLRRLVEVMLRTKGALE